MSGIIKPRYGAEVYVNRRGQVTIKQERHEMQEEHYVFLQSEEVLEIIEHLRATYEEALQFQPETEDEDPT
ncbi:MAG TPA: hypothetical protein PKM59_12510 [Thermodesulfobacteriota bacterium]|nr:hypothetical protein [Thermodesulfobacteriota bacterium]